MGERNFDGWWWQYCDQHGMDNSKRSPIVKDVWTACQIEFDEERAKIEPEINGLKDKISELLANVDKLKAENIQLKSKEKEIDKLQNMDGGGTFDAQSDLRKMSESLRGRPPSNTRMEEVSYRSLGIMLGTIWLEYLVRGIGFGVGIAFALGLIRAIFHIGIF